MPYCRVAPSLGALEGTPLEAWGTPEYVYKLHKNKPCVFFGLYDLRDYLALWRHKGKKWVLWAGSDIRNLSNGFALNDGKLKWISRINLMWWIKQVLSTAEHWVENEWESWELQKQGIESQVCPSFMGNINDYPISYVPPIPGNVRRKVYVSCGGGRQIEYGFNIVDALAKELPAVQFHLYGDTWQPKTRNVISHGRVPKEQMNEEIKQMHTGLRLNDTDGFSEITAKSVLWGQYPITRLAQRLIPQAENMMALIAYLTSQPPREPNTAGRDYYRSILNKYPWYAKPI